MARDIVIGGATIVNELALEVRELRGAMLKVLGVFWKKE